MRRCEENTQTAQLLDFRINKDNCNEQTFHSSGLLCVFERQATHISAWQGYQPQFLEANFGVLLCYTQDPF